VFQKLHEKFQGSTVKVKEVKEVSEVKEVID
jgi:hypothetical protein